MVESFDEAAHVVPMGVGEQLEELGAEVVLEWPDNLAQGPASGEPREHRERRLDYWRGVYERAMPGADDDQISTALAELEDGYMSTEQIGSVVGHHAGERPVLIWSTPTFQDRLFLWACFDAVRSLGVDDVATVEPQVRDPIRAEEYLPLRELEVAELAEGLDTVLYPEEVYREAGADLWQTFATGSPREFAISIPHTEKFFPNIVDIGERYGTMFPRAEGEAARRVQLSEYDAALLGRLSTDEWREPTAVLGEEIIGRFGFVDDVVHVARLVDWSEKSADSAYVDDRKTDREGPFGGMEFRLTDRGTEVVDEGFEEEVDAPVFELGASRIYAGPTPWVKVVEGEHWWFERWEGAD